MNDSLDKLTVKGFKSIKDLTDFELTHLNIIIGGNGAGKSNLISFFRMLRALVDGNLNRYVKDNGGAGDLLFNGRKHTKQWSLKLCSVPEVSGSSCPPHPMTPVHWKMKHAFSVEAPRAGGNWETVENGKSQMVAEVLKDTGDAKYSKPVYEAISSWQIYHFHDTSSTAAMRHYEIVQDNMALRTDAANIGPFLLKLKKEQTRAYNEILNAVRMVTPFFDDFLLEPREAGSKLEVNLSWTQKGSDYPMQPYHFSDGTIRFICLATALLQPDPPSTIIIDEPELGLHPAAISILGELIEVASQNTQVIVATQSPALIDQFAIKDIVVVNREDGASTFKRLKEKDFSVWLENYSVGELWTKNVIAGGPVYE